MDSRENYEARTCRLYENYGDISVVTEDINKLSGKTFYLELPVPKDSNDSQPLVWDDFEWEVIEPKVEEPLPVVLVSKGFGRKSTDQPLYTYKLSFFNLSSELIKLKVTGRAKRYVFNVWQ
ncbi:hypothetical protein [Priestia aryabhattai]|uniref:hypothetical protein n=1 Tax=Priestia aryabhattai TaxID=412384 RepID=UPI003735BBD7